MTDEPQADAPRATVSTYRDWHLVRCGTWEISVAPDGLLMLPRHLAPGEVTDFCNCAIAAAEVGRKVQEENATKTKDVDLENLPDGTHAIVTEGEPPEGATRIPVMPRAASPTPHQERSTIGRPRRARTGGDPRQPRTTQPPTPPTVGARNGRTRQAPAS